MANANIESPLCQGSRYGLRCVQLLACPPSSLSLRLSHGWCPPLHARHRAPMPRVYCPWGACLGVIHSLCQGTAQVPRTVLGAGLQGFTRQTLEGLRGWGCAGLSACERSLAGDQERPPHPTCPSRPSQGQM